jgi:hypothetical protein
MGWIRVWLVVICFAVAKSRAVEPAVERNPYVEALEREAYGLATVGDLNFPKAFLRRVADRSLRTHFRRAARGVARDDGIRRWSWDESGFAGSGVRVTAHGLDGENLSRWKGLEEGAAELVGYWPMEGLATWRSMTAEAGDREVARFVGRRLGRGGLVRTTLEVVLRGWNSSNWDEEAFRAVGIPVDLWRFYSVGEAPFREWLRAWVGRGAPGEEVERAVKGAVFRFEPTVSEFLVGREDGVGRLGCVRMQVPVARYVWGERDGSALDVVRRVATLSGDA